MLSHKTDKRLQIEDRAKEVAISAKHRQEIADFFTSLVDEANQGSISPEDAAWGIAWLMPHPLVLYDDLLNDIATLAAEFEVPAHNPAALADRAETFDLLCSLIRSAQG